MEKKAPVMLSMGAFVAFASGAAKREGEVT
jgi:hypothetical protein